MAYPTEHTARQTAPRRFVSLRRESDEFGPGRDVIYGIKSEADAGPRGGRTEVQSVRFDARIHSAADAKKWLEDNEFSTEDFRPAQSSVRRNPGLRYDALRAAAERMNAAGKIDEPEASTLQAVLDEMTRRENTGEDGMPVRLTVLEQILRDVGPSAEPTRIETAVRWGLKASLAGVGMHLLSETSSDTLAGRLASKAIKTVLPVS